MRQPHLLTVAGDRIALKRGGAYVIGRDRLCDVVLNDPACSRRHAQVSVGLSAEIAFVEDLGSMNGTFLNGEPVKTRVAARDGTRLQVGGTLFLLRLRASDDVERCETGTMAFDGHVVQPEVDGGELTGAALLQALQALVDNRREATLFVATPEEPESRVEVRGGDVVAATFGPLTGYNALVKLARQTRGIFWLVAPGDDPCPRTIPDPGPRVLAELRRCLDPAAAR